MSDSSFFMGVLFGALLMGVGMGLFPLVIGLIFKRTSLAIGGFVACVIAGFVLGIIAALPTALGFTAYIAVKARDERKAKIEAYDF
jgi:hypothetical protein